MPPTSAPWSETPNLPKRIASAIARLATLQRSLRWQAAAAESVNPSQADVIELLAARRTGPRLSTVAKQLGVTTASASDTVSALVDKGFVNKTPAADDARAIALQLTRAGRELAKRIACSTEFIESSAAVLPLAGQTTLYQQLLGLILSLQQDERFEDIRTCVGCQHFGVNEHRSEKFPHHCHLVNAPLSDSLLRFDCNEFSPAANTASMKTWLVQLRGSA